MTALSPDRAVQACPSHAKIPDCSECDGWGPALLAALLDARDILNARDGATYRFGRHESTKRDESTHDRTHYSASNQPG